MDAYVALLENTQSAGIVLGMYKFFDILLTLDNAKMESQATWVSSKLFDDELSYYATSVYIYDFYNTVCEHSTAAQCSFLYYYWMFAMTLNIVVALPVVHVAMEYSNVMGYVDDYTTITGWFAWAKWDYHL